RQRADRDVAGRVSRRPSRRFRQRLAARSGGVGPARHLGRRLSAEGGRSLDPLRHRRLSRPRGGAGRRAGHGRGHLRPGADPLSDDRRRPGSAARRRLGRGGGRSPPARGHRPGRRRRSEPTAG
ncbi:hypothetical protein LTR94_035324, partial [Friedmanniomyces endolithicus]